MNTITQRLRSLANVLQECDLEMNASKLLAIAAELEAPAADAPKIVAWEYARRYGSGVSFARPDDYTDEDGYLVTPTPLIRQRDHLATVSALQADITSEREHASKLRETFLRMQQDQINTAKPLDDPRLQELFGCAIDGALTIG